MSELRSFAKRIFDVLLASVTLVALMPLLLAIAVLVKLTSKGPALYRQERVGKNGTPFVILKFRTMADGAEAQTGPTLSTTGDKRVTPVGGILRRFRLDELPQLVNILKGEMSVVGPRPERPCFVEQFSEIIPGYRDRHKVKPGLTGLAQVLGTYSTPAERKLAYDLAYIHRQSLWLDFSIIVRTVPVLFMPDAARGVPEDRKIVSGLEQSSGLGLN